MLKNCGLGVCMANGQDKAKEAADMICGDNDHDGIAYALEKILER
ncbi:MAG: HAD hydrolase family protein [Solobacterium sp.]|nr:HAD hydrolase family protein [Solobacterium sp.]MCI7157332.1 HAD hydrolase family protein [Solobacterium sp.]